MTDYAYESILAADPFSFERAANADMAIYDATDDNNSTLLTLKDLNGIALPNPLKSSSDGFMPAFVTTSPQVKMVGGGLGVIASSYEGVKAEAVAAKIAAQAAAADAAEAALNAQAPTDVQVDAGIVRADIPGQVSAVVPPLVNAQVTPLVGPLVADAIANDPSVASSAATMAQSTAGLIPKWKASTSYVIGEWRISPTGAIVSSLTNHTSGASWTATYATTNWSIVSGVPKGRIALNTDMNNLKTPGWYVIHNQATADSCLNLPIKVPSVIVVEGDADPVNGSTIVFFQQQKTYGNPALGGNQVRERSTASAVAWNPWVDPRAIPAPVVVPATEYALDNRALLDTFVQRRGGRIGTNGLPVVALRFDHGAVNFRDKVLPKLQSRSLPAGLAINPGPARLALPENAGVTWADYNDWAVNHGIEPLDHGMDHVDATDLASMTTQLVDSQALLQANMPTSAIECLAVPGVSGTDMNGWTATDTPRHFGSTYDAGRLALSAHALVTGYMPGRYRTLDGKPANGETHYAMDNVVVASTITDMITEAQAYGAGLQLMLHPSRVDYGDGYITTAVLNEILDFIADERDAGRLLVLSMSGLMLADSSTSYRHNLVRNAGFNTFYGWAGSAGYTTSGGAATSSSSAGLLTQTVGMSNQAWAAGAVRALTAKFTSPEGAVARLSVTHAGTGLAVTRDVTLAAGVPVNVSEFFTVPIGATTLTLSVGRVSGGTVRVEGVGILAA